MVQEAAAPSEPQRVRLLLPGLTPHRSSPEETPPDFFYSANPLAYVFHLLSSLCELVPRDWNNPFAGTSAPRLVVEKKDGRARLGLEEEATFYEHTAVANSRWEIAR